MKVIDTYNAIVGSIVAVLSYIFGEHWILFALFLAFNLADRITTAQYQELVELMNGGNADE